MAEPIGEFAELLAAVERWRVQSRAIASAYDKEQLGVAARLEEDEVEMLRRVAEAAEEVFATHLK